MGRHLKIGGKWRGESDGFFGAATVEKFGALGNGAADDHDAFVAADGTGHVLVPVGQYLIGSDLTLSSPVVFEPGAVLLPGGGKTVTLNGPVLASPVQIIDTSLTGSVVMAGSPGVLIYPEWWGAVGDGVTDDVVALQAALNAAAALGGGAVALAIGHSYGWSGDLTVPPGVSFQGTNNGKRVGQALLVGLSSDACLRVGGRGVLNQGGMMRDLAIDGGGVADNPFYIGLAVTRGFENITVMNSVVTGMLVEEAQNCSFDGIDVLNSAGDALVFDGGTGGHTFKRLELGGFDGWGLRFRQTYETGLDGETYKQPTHIRFDHPIIERGLGTDPSLGCIHSSASDRILINDPILYQGYATLNGDPGENALVVLEYDSAHATTLCEVELHDASLAGTSLNCGIRLEAQSGLFLSGHTTFKNLTTGIVTNGGYGDMKGYVVWANVTTRYGGSLPGGTILYSHLNELQRVSREVDSFPAFAAMADGDTYDKWEIDGRGIMSFGSGVAPLDTFLYRGAAGHILRTDQRLVGADGVTTKKKAGTPIDGDFAVAPDDATLVVDTTANKLWVRIGGTWKWAALT